MADGRGPQNIHQGSARKLSGEAALQKAGAVKGVALGYSMADTITLRHSQKRDKILGAHGRCQSYRLGERVESLCSNHSDTSVLIQERDKALRGG